MDKPLFKIEDNKIYKLDIKEDEYYFICKNIKIINRLHVFDEDSWYITLSFLDPLNTRKEVIIPQSKLKRQDLLSMMDTGIDIREDNVLDVRGFLYWYLDTNDIPVKLGHKNVGWYYDKDIRKNIYMLDTLIGTKKESTYLGDLPLKSKGSYEEFIKFCHEEVTSSPYLQLALVIGLTAPVLGIITDQIEMENEFICISGNSSSGKSSVCALIMSMWGKSTLSSSNNSLISSWQMTESSLYRSLANMNYFVKCLDELSTNNIKNWSNFIYNYTNGTEKGRMKKDLSQQDRKTWRSLLVSSGEIKIDDLLVDKVIGSSVRIISFDSIPWTKNAEQAHKIKRFTANNHGVVGRLFIEELLEYENTSIIDEWYKYTEILISLMRPYLRQLTERIASKHALFLVTFEILNEMIGMNWDIDNIIDILVHSVEDTNIDLYKRAYDTILNFIVENQSHFIKYKGSGWSNKKTSESPSGNTQIFGKENNNFYVLSQKQFLKLMNNNGFKNPTLVLKQLFEKNLIIPEKDGERKNYYNRYTLGTEQRIPCVVLKKDVNFEE